MLPIKPCTCSPNEPSGSEDRSTTLVGVEELRVGSFELPDRDHQIM